MDIRTSEALAAAIAQAPAGTTLSLGAGTFALPPGWTETRAIALVGQGSDATRLIGAMTAEADLTLVDLAIAGTGERPVVHARTGHLTMSRCRLSEGMLGLLLTQDATAELKDVEIVDQRGDGVRAGDQTQAALSRCLIERNGGDGVAVGGAATVTIENSLVLDNWGCGIAYRDVATGEAYGNLIQGHRGADLVVAGLAGPRLAENTVPEPMPTADAARGLTAA